MCVESVCTHPSYNDRIYTVFFFKIPILKSPFSNQTVLRFLSEWHTSAQAPPTIVDWHDRLTLDPPWVSLELSAIVSTPVQGKTRLRCSVVGCNNEYSIRHLLPTPEPQRINVNFGLKGMRLSRSTYMSLFAQIIHETASSTEEVSIRVFMNLWKTPFLIIC